MSKQMDFFMNYGWAIMVIILVIGGLTYYGHFSMCNYISEELISNPTHKCYGWWQEHVLAPKLRACEECGSLVDKEVVKVVSVCHTCSVFVNDKCVGVNG